MPFYIPESILRPVLQRNCNPFPPKNTYLEEEKALSLRIAALLEEELDIWTIRAHEATTDVEKTAVNRAAAELRLSAARAMKITFLDFKNTLISSVLDIERSYEELQTSSVGQIEPSLHGIAGVLSQWGGGQNWMSDQIDKAHSALVDAENAVTQSLEAQQEALAREERCLATVQAIKDHIQELNRITGARIYRTIWRVPEAIWREIFAIVVDSSCETQGDGSLAPELNPHYPSLILSAVCQLWRTIALKHQYLWRIIQNVVKPDSLVTKRLERTKHYLKLSGSQPLQIIIEVSPKTYDIQEELLKELRSSSNPLGHLIIRGGAMGKEVFLFIARTISTPEKLTIAFMDQCSFQKLSWTVTSTVNKELTLKNCGPMKIFRRSDTKWAASLIKLKIINSTTERLMWPLFREWIILQVSQMKHLELVTTFSNPQPDDSIEPTSFKSLDSIRTRLGTLIILYRSLLYTPVLRSLTVISSEHVDLEAWKTFVIDSQGGGSITKVTIENDKDANWVSLSTYLRQIPKLQTLEIMGDAVRPLLHSLIEFSESEETSKAERLLKKLTVLSIVDYQDEGEEIFAFASKYLPVHGNISNGDERPGSILRVSLRNCPNISGHIMQMMEEAGLVLDFNSLVPAAPKYPMPGPPQTPGIKPTA